MSFFSIIIPTYNRALFLPKAIDSVLAQTYTDWELIIVDDGSTDNTKDVISKYQDNRIRYIYQSNAERSVARNNGIHHATGMYICFMDSDEYMYPNRLSALQTCIVQDGCKLVCYYTDIKFEGDENYTRYGECFSFPIDKNQLIKVVIGAPQLCCASKILQKYQFNPNLSIGEDLELLFRVTQEYPIRYIKNQANIVDIVHEKRSVNLTSKDIFKQLDTIKIMKNKSHPASSVNKKYYRAMYAGCFLRFTKYYILQQAYWKAIFQCIKSIVYDPYTTQLKYKINIIRLILFDKTRLLRILKDERN